MRNWKSIKRRTDKRPFEKDQKKSTHFFARKYHDRKIVIKLGDPDGSV